MSQQLHLYSPKTTFSPLKEPARWMRPPVKISLIPLIQTVIATWHNYSTVATQIHLQVDKPKATVSPMQKKFQLTFSFNTGPQRNLGFSVSLVPVLYIYLKYQVVDTQLLLTFPDNLASKQQTFLSHFTYRTEAQILANTQCLKHHIKIPRLSTKKLMFQLLNKYRAFAANDPTRHYQAQVN